MADSAAAIAEVEQVEVETPAGLARWHLSRVPGRPLVQLFLGHGAGGGVDSADLRALAAVLPGAGVEVARFEQPWRVAGRKVAGPPAGLDSAWIRAVAAVRRPELALVVGGRSAGARVACRTAEAVGAGGVLALAFPLHPAGRSDRSRADEIPTMPVLVVQGSRDPFGTPAELRQHLSDQQQLLEIPGGDHSFNVRRSGPITSAEAREVLVIGVRRWLQTLRST
ncbi:MAG: alpha/beta family hydrolase [Actinomycetes bacterium]